MIKKHSPLHVFTSFMMTYVIPYDTRLSTLVKKRDFQRHSAYFHIMKSYIHNSKNMTSSDYIESLESKLASITIPIYRFYCIVLLQKFEPNEKEKHLEKLDELLSDNGKSAQELLMEYHSVVISIEKELDINQNNLPIQSCDEHQRADMYKKDHETMFLVLQQTYIALEHLEAELRKHPLLCKQKDQQQELDYLIKVVNFELWNFISHISHAYTDFFKTPKLFISDIEKGTSHLRRAIMDIYDGLIVDIYHDKITPEYLNLRNQKILSLGQSNQIFSLSESLRDYYMKISS